MPLSMQKLFTNAPMSLSPQHSLLLFVSACFTLCMITVSLVFQVCLYWQPVYSYWLFIWCITGR